MKKRLEEIEIANDVVNHNNPVFHENVSWLIQNIKRYEEERKQLRDLIIRSRCEECGHELGNEWEISNGLLCNECFGDLEEREDD